MERTEMASWDEARWEAAYNDLMEIARNHLRPEWPQGEVIAVKTLSGAVRVLEIPDFVNADLREPLENAFLQDLADRGEAQVLLCLATISGVHPEIPSWNFRSRLVDMDSSNLQTHTFLWGGGELVLAKPFSSLLPPEK